MSNTIPQVFNFDSNQVRVINDNPFKPMFVAVDVARALGYKNTRDAISKCKNKATVAIHDGRQNRNIVTIPEPDVYRLVFGSKLKSAVKFQDWIFEEVLPSIRQTGEFHLQTPSQKEQLLLSDGRQALDKGVKSLVSTLKRNGKQATYRDVWKLIHLKSGMLGIGEATPEQIETGMTYVTEALEGELLSPETQQETDVDLINLLNFTSERIQFIVDAESKIDQAAKLITDLQSQVATARYHTCDLRLYLKIHANKLIAKQNPPGLVSS